MASLSIIQHDHDGCAVPQRVSDGYVNLTAMAQQYGKQTNDYFRLKGTKEFIEALSCDTKIPVTALFQVLQGGNGVQGTWAHPEVAIDFAQWLDVRFRIWANRTLRAVMKEGAIAAPHSKQLLQGLVLPTARTWNARFYPEWRNEASRLTGWSWGARCMYRFVDQCTYDWFPPEIRCEIDRLNPVVNGRRKSRIHQYLEGDALTALDRQINKSYDLMQGSQSKEAFEVSLNQAMTGRYQISLKLS